MFTFFLSPLKIVGATGSPVRPLAVRAKAHDMTEALSGLRVLDASNSVAGQFCGRLFADNGAAVVLAEAPGRFGHDGAWLPFAPDGSSTLFAHLNAGKTSLVVADRRASRDRLRTLAERADVMIVDSDDESGVRSSPTARARARSASSRRSGLGRWKTGREASSSTRR